MLDRIHIFISLIAAIAAVIYGIATNLTLSEAAAPVIAAIMIFYLVGLLVREFLMKKVFVKNEQTVENADIVNEEVIEAAEETDVDFENEDDFDETEIDEIKDE